MKVWTWLLAAVAMIGLAAGPSQESRAQQRGWALCQSSPHSGMWYVYITPGGLAAVNQKIGATMVTRAPQWNVVLYNNKTKVYYLSTLAEWKGQFQDTAKNKKYKQTVQKTVEAPPRKTGKTTRIAGLSATQYISDTSLPGAGARRMEFWVTTDIQVPDQLTQILAKTYGYGMSSLKGMPIRVAYVDETGKKNVVVETLKCESRAIPAASFTYPASYTRVDNEVAVFMDEKGRKAMDSIMDDLGSSDDLGSLLGEGSSSSGGSRRSSSSYSSGSSYGSSSYGSGSSYGTGASRSPASVSRPATASTPAASKPASGGQQGGDWFGSLFNSFGKK